MAKPKSNEIIVGLDIGTTKIACIAGEVTEDGVDIIGIGSAPSKGLRRGYVVNIDATVSAIQQAVDEAENMAGCEISTVYAAISGAHVRGINSHGIIAVKDREVRETDIARVIEQAKAVAIPMDREVLHVLPQQYVVDDQDGIRDPLGMAGVRLEAKVHMVTTAVASAQNVVKCANRCNLQVADIVLESLAAAQAVLEEDEKELGVALIDIGGGTCDVMVYCDGAIVHTSVLPLGGGHSARSCTRVSCRSVAVTSRMTSRRSCAPRSTAPRRSSASTAARGAVTSRTASRWKCHRSVVAAPACCHASRSSKSSSRASKKSSSTSRRSSCAPATTTRSRRASCSPVARRRWTA
jgi:cell division protein FtsA